jgi:hypothetical protein
MSTRIALKGYAQSILFKHSNHKHMNKLFFLIAISAITFSSSSAQDTTKASQLLTHYYALKDALVAGNSNQAAAHAEAFQKAASSTDSKTSSVLVKDAGKISSTKDLKKQREYFASFSTGMVAFAKSVKLTDQPVYVAYCPMKKATWLTSNQAIKNPYYGSSMLTCGEITETIK